MVCCTCYLLTITTMSVLVQTQDSSLDRIMKDLDKLLNERQIKLDKSRLKLGHFGQALNFKARYMQLELNSEGPFTIMISH